MINGILLQSIALKNHLLLKIFDTSKKIAGDRWLVSIIATVDIPLSTIKNMIPKSQFAEFQELLGDSVSFSKKTERNFIDEKEKDAMVHELVDSFLQSALEYLSREQFPEKLLMRQFVKAKTSFRRPEERMKSGAGDSGHENGV
jgi:hypothetical protein